MSVGRYAYSTQQEPHALMQEHGNLRATARRAWRKSGKRRSFQSFVTDIRQSISRSNTHGGAQQ